MKVLIAPDKFKGSLTAEQAGRAIERGVKLAAPRAETEIIPMADGGEGTIEAIKKCVPGKMVRVDAQDPLGRPIRASYLVVDKSSLPLPAQRRLKGSGRSIAFVEMSQAGGYLLLKDEERDPELTSTFGVGMIIKHALIRGVDTIVLTVGGSATNDGGIGMASALGYRFIGANGRSLRPIGKELAKIKKIDMPESSEKLAEEPNHFVTRRKSVRFFVAADVENPFYGKQGAAHVFAPQKGANVRMVNRLDNGLRNLASVVKRGTGIDLQKMPGSGAAGGLGGGAMVFLNAQLVSGSMLMAEIVNAKAKARDADLCIVAEGSFDLQSLSGKAPIKIAEIVQPVPVIMLAGAVDPLAVKAIRSRAIPIASAFSIINEPMDLNKAKASAGRLLEILALSVTSTFIAGKDGLK